MIVEIYILNIKHSKNGFATWKVGWVYHQKEFRLFCRGSKIRDPNVGNIQAPHRNFGQQTTAHWRTCCFIQNKKLFKTGNILRLKRSDGAKKTGNIVDICKCVTFSKKSLIYWFYWDHLGWKMVTPVTLHVLITNHSSQLSSKLQPIALKSSGSTWSTQKSLFSTST